VSKERIGRLQRWILLALLDKKYVNYDGKVCIDQGNIYQGYYGVQQYGHGYRAHRWYLYKETAHRARSAWPAVCMSLRLMKEKGLIETRPYSCDYCLTSKGKKVAKSLKLMGDAPASSPARPAGHGTADATAANNNKENPRSGVMAGHVPGRGDINNKKLIKEIDEVQAMLGKILKK